MFENKINRALGHLVCGIWNEQRKQQSDTGKQGHSLQIVTATRN